MEARLQARRALELDLREALAKNEFELHYQPIFDLRRRSDRRSSRRCCVGGTQSRGMVSPAEFIPIAEDIGLIIPLGDWVLKRACAEASVWPVMSKLR